MKSWHGVKQVKQNPVRKFEAGVLAKPINSNEQPDYLQYSSFMCGEWWYELNGSVWPESAIKLVN